MINLNFPNFQGLVPVALLKKNYSSLKKNGWMGRIYSIKQND
jgi:hypothetical protein